MSRVLKVCGVQSALEAKLLLECGVDFVGLNFIPDSSRCLSLDAALEIMEVYRSSSVKTVALFRDQSLKQVANYADRMGVDYAQLCGSESQEYQNAIRIPVMRTIAVDQADTASQLCAFISTHPAAYYILDRKKQGSGALVALDMASEVSAKYPDKIFLAGGLTPDNLANALSQASPYGIDIAAGVRTGDNLDHDKVMSCLAVIRQSQ
jgi:phosphoribosylanthranilate isomerase